MNQQLMIDVSLHWVAVVIYAVATLVNLCGLIFRKEKAERAGYLLVVLGLLVHGAVLIYRWSYSGHGPYMTRYEVLSSNAWVGLFSFLVFCRFFPKIKAASLVVFPAGFLLIALGLFTNPGIQKLPPTLRSIWLVLHVAFYKISLGTLLIALAFSLFFIFKKRTGFQWLQRVPELNGLDLLSHRFVGFGFVLWAIAMLAGSIWAYQSWGRFWAWDPVETWSLITWVLFGLYLHLRRFHGLRGEVAALFYLLCFIVSLLALFFTPMLDSSIHSEYFT